MVSFELLCRRLCVSGEEMMIVQGHIISMNARKFVYVCTYDEYLALCSIGLAIVASEKMVTDCVLAHNTPDEYA